MAFLRRRPKVARQAADAAEDAAESAIAAATPSPNPATNLLIADIALRGGGALLKRAVEAGLLGASGVGKGKAKDAIKGRSLGQTLVGTAIARVATRSVPGALLVSGGLLAKTLYDRKRARSAAAEGHEKLDKQARKGRK
jgi:hypothetical protein